MLPCPNNDAWRRSLHWVGRLFNLRAGFHSQSPLWCAEAQAGSWPGCTYQSHGDASATSIYTIANWSFLQREKANWFKLSQYPVEVFEKQLLVTHFSTYLWIVLVCCKRLQSRRRVLTIAASIANSKDGHFSTIPWVWNFMTRKRCEPVPLCYGKCSQNRVY